jgi:hypothetical protein
MAQNKNVAEYFKLKPSDIQSQNNGIQEYDVTLKWQNLDAINGSKINCNIVRATYFAGLENDRVGWKNVSVAQIDDFRQTQYESIDLPAFDDFSYKAVDTAFLSEEFYSIIPVEQRDLAKAQKNVQILEEFLTGSGANYQQLIVDLRRNGGGSPVYGEELLVKPFIKTAVQYVQYAAVKKRYMRNSTVKMLQLEP